MKIITIVGARLQFIKAVVVSRKINKMGIPVIFDIHENIAVQILDKEYIPSLLREIASFFTQELKHISLNIFT